MCLGGAPAPSGAHVQGVNSERHRGKGPTPIDRAHSPQTHRDPLAPPFSCRLLLRAAPPSIASGSHQQSLQPEGLIIASSGARASMVLALGPPVERHV